MVGPQTDWELEEGHSGQPHGPPALLVSQLRPGEHDINKAPAAEDGDNHRDEEGDKTQLQPHRKHHAQLLGEVLTASRITLLVGKLWDNDHNATVCKGQGPEDPSSNYSMHRPAKQLVLHGESHSQVALHADAHREP